MEATPNPVLSVRDLVVHLRSGDGPVRAVDGVSFEIRPGETVGLVGESGSGKSITALSILSLIPRNNIGFRSGSVLFEGTDLNTMSDRDVRSVRGNRIGMIFQEPMTSLNPVLTIGRQIGESLVRHRGLSDREAELDAIQLLDRVGIPSAKARVREYPHQLSGGMRQRAMIAIAIACKPKLLIADEPTTALDVTIQAQILELIDELKRELDMGVLMITHNFGVVAQTADRTAVMYAGRIVEQADTVSLFDGPAHPYTAGLLAAMPRLGAKAASGRHKLREIPGIVPRLTVERQHCAFAARCSHRVEACLSSQPSISVTEAGHQVRCFVPQARLGQELAMETGS
ncbi:ABC transporter ATP-binding protein [Arvimicrobium flavum]|uniref:ABC transporter ATP-binding protein n=1 Tax=Arvimicrobium flavum TaxID=3393320 RepID=UPI00398CB29E